MEARGPYKRHLQPNSNCPITPHTKKRLARAVAALQAEVAGNDGETLPQDKYHEGYQGDDDGTPFLDQDDMDSSEEEEPEDDLHGAFTDGDHPFKKLMDFLCSNQPFQRCISINPGEILLAVLTHAVVHNMSMSAACGIFKMLNMILGTSIFPSSRYFFKSLFNPHDGCDIHLVCENCKSYLGKHFQNGVFTCKDCSHENVIKGYRYDYAFITLDVKSQLRRMIIDGELKLTPRREKDTETYQDIECGSMYRKNVPKLAGNEDIMYLSCTFNCDAAPISRNSRTAITPMLFMINEAEVNCRGKNIVNAGLWYGKEKPRMEVFLEPFKDMFNDLMETGFPVFLENKCVTVKLSAICCCVDTVARAPMQGVTAVNGYYCCSWCTIKGEEVQGTIKYPLPAVAPEVRTDSKFLECCKELAKTKDRVLGVKMVSPLINLTTFSMIWGFVPDYMHCVLLGIVRRLMNLWLTNCRTPYYIGKPININVVDSCLRKIKPPQYLKRAPVSLSMRGTMKARELENFFLFYSVPALDGVLSTPYFNHWKLLVNGCNLLLQDRVTHDEVDEAELLLLEFVLKTEELYGSFEMTYNMHQLLHMAESVRRWGPLWTRTAFPFESALGEMCKVIKATRGVPHQIVRQIEVNRSRQVIFSHGNIGDSATAYCTDLLNYRHATRSDILGPTVVALGNGVSYNGLPYNLPVDCPLFEYQKVVRNGMIFSNFSKTDQKKTDNSYVELCDGRFARIQHIVGCAGRDETDGTYFVLQICNVVNVPKLIHIQKFLGYSQTISCPFSLVKSVAVAVEKESERYLCKIPSKHFLLNL